MRKSITSLICGLIGSLFSLWWGFVFGFLGNALGIISDAEAQSIGMTLTILGWLAFLGGILAIVGSALCVKKARKGAVCLTIATIMCGALQLYLFIQTVGNTGTFFMTSIVIFLLPTILLLVAAIFAWIAKEIPVQTHQAYNQTQFSQQAPQQKTLEQELSDLKGMLDKNLITEEEFAEAKKSILAKYTK